MRRLEDEEMMMNQNVENGRKKNIGYVDTTPEIFFHLSDEIIDCLYELGAYDMYCSGMLD